MNKIPHPFKNIFILLTLALSLAVFVFLALGPSQQAKAAGTALQNGTDSCKTCHYKQYDLWTESKHGTVPVNCETCHRLGGEGAHPEVPYLISDQSLTCDTCHSEIAAQWKASRHGEVGLSCTSCHEVHSQQQKVLDDNQLICANCHKEQYNLAHDSTHGAAGLSCQNCHLGADSGHSFKATIVSCESCHENLHEANNLIAAGATIEPVVPSDPAAAAPEATAESVPADPEAETSTDGGIHLPSWLLLVAGLLVGGVLSWVVFGRDPGTPTAEK